MIKRLVQWLWSKEEEIPDEQKAEVAQVLAEAHQEVGESRRARKRALEYEYQLSARRGRHR